MDAVAALRGLEDFARFLEVDMVMGLTVACFSAVAPLMRMTRRLSSRFGLIIPAVGDGLVFMGAVEVDSAVPFDCVDEAA